MDNKNALLVYKPQNYFARKTSAYELFPRYIYNTFRINTMIILYTNLEGLSERKKTVGNILTGHPHGGGD